MPSPHKQVPLEQRQAEMAARHAPTTQDKINTLVADVQSHLAKPRDGSDRESRLSAKEAIRLFLTDVPSKKNPEGYSRLQRVVNAVYDVAINPKSPQQITAAKLLLERGFGKPADENGDTGRNRGGLTVVYVDRKAIDPDIPILDAQPALPAPAQPEFIDAEYED